MKSIAVPKSFFESERNHVYSNWTAAFWRELLSNSVDADASRIAIRTRFDKSRNYVVDFIDNGIGMDRDTVENVYMRLGASTKGEGTAGIGGFGRARLLTCFSHEAYRIRTRDIVVKGQGANYEIEQSSQAVPGCALSITVDPAFAHRLQVNLEMVLRASSLRTAIVLDLAREDPEGGSLPVPPGDQVTPLSDGRFRFNAWTRKGKHFRSLEDETSCWAQLHVSRGEKALKNRAIVRVDGMSMYDEHISAPVQIVADINPARAREILTASRDSIRGEFRVELQKVFSEIASEQTSAFRDRTRRISSRIFRNPDTPAGTPVPMYAAASPRSASGAAAAPPPPSPQPRSAPSHRGEVDYSMEQDAQAIGFLRYEVLIDVNDPTPGQAAAIPRYRPDRWAGGSGEGRVAEMLHAAWSAACRTALQALVKRHPEAVGPQERWSTGFTFDRHNEATYRSLPDVDHVYLVNPVDEAGRMRYRISDPASMNRLAALAIHEVAHTCSKYHDETFAGIMTDLTGDIRGKDMDLAIRRELDLQRDWGRQRKAVIADSPAPAPDI